MNILALETTCDETAAAIVTDQLEVKASVVASQDDLHGRFGGVVPEIASRAHLERILPVIDQALREANISLGELDAVAVANTPGLAGSLLVGLTAAKALCVGAENPPAGRQPPSGPHLRLPPGRGAARSLPLRRADRQRRTHQPLPLPGTARLRTPRRQPSTTPPARRSTKWPPCWDCLIRAGRRSRGPRPTAIPGPTPCPALSCADDDRLDFSFSGLKTAVRYTLVGPGKPDFSRLDLSGQLVADLAASFQEAVVDVLVDKAFAAMAKTGLRILCVGGGVAANVRLRQRLAEEAARRGAELHVAPPRLCTDNAVMGAIAVERWKAGLTESLDLEIVPGVLRKGTAVPSPSGRGLAAC